MPPCLACRHRGMSLTVQPDCVKYYTLILSVGWHLYMYTDEYRACIWTSLGEFRYERYESVYVTLLTVLVFYYPNITNLYYLPNIKSFLQKLKHCQVMQFTTACHHWERRSFVTLRHNNRSVHASQCETHCLYWPCMVEYTVSRYITNPLMFIVIYRHNN